MDLPQKGRFVQGFHHFSSHITKCHACHGICTLLPLRAALTMRFAKIRNTTRLKCCACHAKWRWRLSKCCACHSKTIFDTWRNTSECHKVPRMPRENEATQRWIHSKITSFAELPIGTATATSCETVADGCGRKHVVQRTRPQPPSPQSENGKPLLRIRGKTCNWPAAPVARNLSLVNQKVVGYSMPVVTVLLRRSNTQNSALVGKTSPIPFGTMNEIEVLPDFYLHRYHRLVTFIWLVVSTPLKNISQLGWLFPIYGKIENVPNHQPVMYTINISWARKTSPVPWRAAPARCKGRFDEFIQVLGSLKSPTNRHLGMGGWYFMDGLCMFMHVYGCLWTVYHWKTSSLLWQIIIFYIIRSTILGHFP